MEFENAPSHLRELLSNFEEVKLLLKLHKTAAGDGPGRKYDVEIINKSAIVLTVACWEAYVEDLAKNSLSILISDSKSFRVFPEKILESVANKNNGIHAWKLANDGWKQVMRDNLQEVLIHTVGMFHAPKTSNVNDLFKKTVGYEKISGSWSWSGRTSASATSDLDKLVNLRNDIAHRVRATNSVRKKDVLKAIELISRLAAKSNNAMCSHLNKLCGKEPWIRIQYGKTG